jgi:hypothetical protein
MASSAMGDPSFVSLHCHDPATTSPTDCARLPLQSTVFIPAGPRLLPNTQHKSNSGPFTSRSHRSSCSRSSKTRSRATIGLRMALISIISSRITLITTILKSNSIISCRLRSIKLHQVLRLTRHLPRRRSILHLPGHRQGMLHLQVHPLIRVLLQRGSILHRQGHHQDTSHLGTSLPLVPHHLTLSNHHLVGNPRHITTGR